MSKYGKRLAAVRRSETDSEGRRLIASISFLYWIELRTRNQSKKVDLCVQCIAFNLPQCCDQRVCGGQVAGSLALLRIVFVFGLGVIE